MKATRVPGGSLVLDLSLAHKLYEEFFGMPLGLKKVPKGHKFNRPLFLDKYETLYLAERRGLKVLKQGKELGIEELKRSYKLNESVYRVYTYLRDQGFIVRNGARFGADFLVYEKGPGLEHAPYAVLVISNPLGRDLARIVRVSHSVRKYALIAFVHEGSIRFYKVRRFKSLE